MKFSCVMAFIIAITFFYFIFKLFSYISKRLLDTDRPKFVYVPPRDRK